MCRRILLHNWTTVVLRIIIYSLGVLGGVVAARAIAAGARLGGFDWKSCQLSGVLKLMGWDGGLSPPPPGTRSTLILRLLLKRDGNGCRNSRSDHSTGELKLCFIACWRRVATCVMDGKRRAKASTPAPSIPTPTSPSATHSLSTHGVFHRPNVD